MGVEMIAAAARLDAVEAGALARRLLEVRGRPVELALGALERVSTPGVQVLLSAARTWAADGAELRLADPAPALLEALATLGVPASALPLGEAR